MTVDAGRTAILPVRPEDLDEPVIEVTPRPNTNSTMVLSIVGPPGAFDLDQDNRSSSAVQTAKEFASRIGFSEEVLSSDGGSSIDWRLDGPDEVDTGREHLLTGATLYHGLSACIEGESDSCETSARFVLDCDDCTQVIGFVRPTPGDVLAGIGAISVSDLGGVNSLRLLFEADGRLVAAQIHIALDLDASVVLDPDTARSAVLADLRDQGYDVLTEGIPNRSQIEIHQEGVSPGSGLYHWTVVVERGSASEWPDSAGRAAVFVEQDAVTGRIVTDELRPTVAVKPGRPKDPLPTPGLGLLFSAVAAASLAWRRRRR